MFRPRRDGKRDPEWLAPMMDDVLSDFAARVEAADDPDLAAIAARRRAEAGADAEEQVAAGREFVAGWVAAGDAWPPAGEGLRRLAEALRAEAPGRAGRPLTDAERERLDELVRAALDAAAGGTADALGAVGAARLYPRDGGAGSPSA